MRKFKIYAGMTGGFNDVRYRQTVEVETESEAYEIACEWARDEFESYAGLHGVLDYGECLDECDGDEEAADQMYQDEFETWTEYYAEEVQ